MDHRRHFASLRRHGASLLRPAATSVSILVFLLLSAQQSGKPLHLDDVDHFGIARAISETGKPVYYRGEALPALSGALHPPLNDYLLAGWFLIFGVGIVQARAFAAFFMLLHGGAVLLLMRGLYPPPIVARMTPLFWSLFLLNPYTLQMASMVDIDSSTYGPLLLLLLWSVIRLFWRQGERRSDPPRWWEFGFVALLLAVCLWTKLTTVLLVIPFIFLLLLPRMTALRAFLTAQLTVGLGIATFLVSFWLCCRAWGLDPSATVRFVHATARGGGRLEAWSDTLAFMGSHLTRWTGFLPWLAVGTALLVGLQSALRDRRNFRSPALERFLLLTLATATTTYYCATRITFGNAPYKYTFVYYGLLMVPLALLATRSLAEPGAGQETARRPSLPGQPWTLLIYGFVFSYGLFLVLRVLGDSVVQHGWTTSSLFLLGLPAVVGGCACVLSAFGGGAVRRPAQLLLGVVLCFHLGVQLGVAFHQSRVDYSTTYDYGQRGLVEAARFIRTRTDADDLISSMKDLGMLAGRRYIENYGALYGGDAEALRLIGAWKSGRVRFIVFTEGIGQDQLMVSPMLQEWIAGHAKLVATFGNYRIYEPGA